MEKGKTKKPVHVTDKSGDSRLNYEDFWAVHEYEHASEEMAIKRLLKAQTFKHAVDVGGGYGRLSKLLTDFADKVTLAEPSQQQLDIAKIYLRNYPQVEYKLLKTADLKMPKGSVDLVLLVRVLHNLPDPSREFNEIARILKSGGIFLMEFANDAHFLNRLRYGVSGKKVPHEITSKEFPFYHHPKKIIGLLNSAGFEVEAVLSGSNLRSPRLKKVLGKNIMLGLEKVLQPMLAPLYFGPSVWLRLRKR